MKRKFIVLDIATQYLVPNPYSEKSKQLRRKVIMEQMDESLNRTGNLFLCILSGKSAIAEIKYGDIVEAYLNFDITEDLDQLVFAKIEKVNGVSI